MSELTASGSVTALTFPVSSWMAGGTQAGGFTETPGPPGDLHLSEQRDGTRGLQSDPQTWCREETETETDFVVPLGHLSWITVLSFLNLTSVVMVTPQYTPGLDCTIVVVAMATIIKVAAWDVSLIWVETRRLDDLCCHGYQHNDMAGSE